MFALIFLLALPAVSISASLDNPPNRVIRIGISDGNGKISEIRRLDMEEYLLGVLPHEMDPGWPLEALKAQAVVARSFAYSHLGKYRRQGFDLTSDTRSQVYRGQAEVAASVRRAVEETRGEVLGYKGKLLNVYYHACCGGRTTDSASVWGSADQTPAPLRGVRDRYCARSPHREWSAYFSHAEILAALDGRRLIAGALRSLSINSRDRAGYVKSFRALVGGEEFVVSASDFRRRLGNAALRSIRIRDLGRRRDGVEFFGSGSGHGVGLCQWGARLQAEQGRRYEQVLRLYFPGSTLSVVDE